MIRHFLGHAPIGKNPTAVDARVKSHLNAWRKHPRRRTLFSNLFTNEEYLKALKSADPEEYIELKRLIRREEALDAQVNVLTFHEYLNADKAKPNPDTRGPISR